MPNVELNAVNRDRSASCDSAFCHSSFVTDSAFVIVHPWLNAQLAEWSNLSRVRGKGFARSITDSRNDAEKQS
jgi:hypothetical protein